MSEQWVLATSLEAVPQGDVIAVEARGREVAIYGVEGAVYATDNICTHAHARLCEGFLEGFEIECPMHQGKFDVRDGRPLCAPVTEAIRAYRVKIEAGQVYLALE